MVFDIQKIVLMLTMTANDYLDQYRDNKLFHKEYVGEPLLNPFINYADVKNSYPIQVIDLTISS